MQQQSCKPHLVYVGLEKEKKLMIYVHVEENVLGDHTCDAYHPNWRMRRVESEDKVKSAQVKVENLGWVDDVDEFYNDITSMPFPAGRHNLSEEEEKEAFDSWKLAVLEHLAENCSRNWQKNDSNYR
jgi:hypothetical protein